LPCDYDRCRGNFQWSAEEEFTVTVSYHGKPSGVNLTNLPNLAGWANYGDGIFVASEPAGAAGWYPVNDHPLDKATYSLDITVPEPFVVAANGVLQDTIENEDGTLCIPGPGRALRQPFPPNVLGGRRARTPSRRESFTRTLRPVLEQGRHGASRGRLPHPVVAPWLFVSVERNDDHGPTQAPSPGHASGEPCWIPPRGGKSSFGCLHPNAAVKWKALPFPISLSTQIRPPIISTRSAQMASPRPRPP